MVPVVVDTDVFSFGLKGDTRAMRYETHLVDRILVVSFMTVAELERGARERNWGVRRRQELEVRLKSRVIHFPDWTTCQIWGEIMAEGIKKGHPIRVGDAWVAATAIQHACPLVTHNDKDFRAVAGLVVISEPDRPA